MPTVTVTFIFIFLHSSIVPIFFHTTLCCGETNFSKHQMVAPTKFFGTETKFSDENHENTSLVYQIFSDAKVYLNTKWYLTMFFDAVRQKKLAKKDLIPSFYLFTYQNFSKTQTPKILKILFPRQNTKNFKNFVTYLQISRCRKIYIYPAFTLPLLFNGATNLKDNKVFEHCAKNDIKVTRSLYELFDVCVQ